MPRLAALFVLGLALVAACPPATTTGTGAGGNPTLPADQRPRGPRVVNPIAMCKRMADLHEQHCGLFGEIALTGTCVQEVTGALADPRSRPTTEQMDECTTELTVCSDIVACVGALESSGELRGCDDRDELHLSSPVGLPYRAWRQDMARGLTKLSATVSSHEKPVELCGVATENSWLTTLACDDGSRPLATHADAEKTRLGNVGTGGRCQSVIDHYRVACPEHAYDVFIDGQVCPQPE